MTLWNHIITKFINENVLSTDERILVLNTLLNLTKKKLNKCIEINDTTHKIITYFFHWLPRINLQRVQYNPYHQLDIDRYLLLKIPKKKIRKIIIIKSKRKRDTDKYKVIIRKWTFDINKMSWCRSCLLISSILNSNDLRIRKKLLIIHSETVVEARFKAIGERTVYWC